MIEKKTEARAPGLKTMAGYGVGKAVPGLLTFLAVPVLVGIAGPGGYAVFSLSWALTLFTGSLGTGWLRTAMLRFAGDAQKRLRMMPKAAIAASVGCPAVAASVAMACLGAVVPAATTSQVLISTLLFAIASNVYGLLLSRTQRDVRSLRFAVAETCRVFVGILASFVILRNDGLGPAPGLLFGHVVGTAVGACVLIDARFSTWRTGAGSRGEVGRAYWSYGWPMSLWLAAAASLVYSDRFVASAYLGADQVGSYFAIADAIVRGFAMIGSPIVMFAHPAVMRAANEQQWQKAGALLLSACRTLIVTMTIAVCAVVVLAPIGIRWFFDQDEPDRGILFLIALGAALWQLALLAHKPLELANRTLIMTWLIATAGAISAGGSALLVREVGLLGIAAGFSFGSCFYVVAVLVAGRMIGNHLAHSSSARL